MNFTEPFRAMVSERFLTEWTLLHPTIPIEIEDVPFKQPKTGSWVRLSILQNPANQVSIGRRVLIRTNGFLQIDVMGPAERGLKVVKGLAEDAANIFFSQKFKTAEITAVFDEKHVDKAPTTGEFVRIMARVFFIYDGEIEKPIVQFL